MVTPMRNATTYARPQWELTSAKRASRSASRPNSAAVRDHNAALRARFAPTEASKRGETSFLRRHSWTASWLLALLLVLMTPFARAELAANVDRQLIDENDVLVLEVRYSGQLRSADLRFERLEQDFVILNQQRGHQLQLIEGRPHAQTSWTLTLQPKRRGALLIPPFTVEGASTQPITITVTEPTPQARRELAEWVFMESDVSADSVWVQEQFTYRVRLFYSEEAVLFGELPPMPRFEEAVVETMGGPSNRMETRNGRRYQVIERRYAIIPQRSGELRLPPESFVGAVRVTQQGAVRRRNLRLTTDGHQIDIRPQPDAWPADATWLPARDLRLTDAFDPQPPRFRQGEPLTRTLMLQARGLAASALPELDFGQTPGVRVYPEPAILDEDRQGEGMVATRIQSSTLIAQVVDFIELPEISVLWWDLDTDEIRRAVVPSRRFPVAPSTLAPAPPEQQAPKPSPAAPEADVAPGTPIGEVRSFPMLTLLAVMLWVGTIGFWFWHAHRRRQGPASAAPAPTQSSSSRERSAVLNACHANDPAAARPALERWIRAHGGHGETLLDALPAKQRAELTPLLRELDRALYAPASDRSWNGRDLAAWVKRHPHPTAQRAQRRPALPPLYAPDPN